MLAGEVGSGGDNEGQEGDHAENQKEKELEAPEGFQAPGRHPAREGHHHQ